MKPSVDNYGTAHRSVTSEPRYFKLKRRLFEASKSATNVSKRYYESPKKTKTDTNNPPIDIGTEIAYSRAKQNK